MFLMFGDPPSIRNETWSALSQALSRDMHLASLAKLSHQQPRFREGPCMAVLGARCSSVCGSCVDGKDFLPGE